MHAHTHVQAHVHPHMHSLTGEHRRRGNRGAVHPEDGRVGIHFYLEVGIHHSKEGEEVTSGLEVLREGGREGGSSIRTDKQLCCHH